MKISQMALELSWSYDCFEREDVSDKLAKELYAQASKLRNASDFWLAIEEGKFEGEYNTLKHRFLHLIFKVFFKNQVL